MRAHGSSVGVELARLVLIVAAPLAALIAYLLYDSARRDEAQAARRVMGMAATTADRAARYVEVTRNELEALARRPLVRAMDPKRCDPQLAELRELYGQPINIIVINIEGRIICGATPPPRGSVLRVADEELLRAMKAAPRFRLSRPFVGRITQRWTVAAVQPVLAPGGGLAGMVAMGFDLAHWVSFSPVAGEPRGTIHDIVTREGVIIARSTGPEAWIGRNAGASEIHRRMLAMGEGTVRALGTEGADRVWGFAPIAGTDWYARSSVAAHRVFDPVQERTVNTLVVLAAVLGAAFLAVVASVARLARPMGMIATAVRARTEGHSEVRVPVAGPREVAELATEMNRMIDTSERREEELRRFRAAMDFSGDAIVLVDRASLRYIDVNNTFCEMVGYTREELLGMTPMDLFSFDRETLERDYDALIADNRSSASLVEGTYRRKDGGLVPVESRRRALRAGGGWIIVGTSRDITERKAAEARRAQDEAELRVAHDELARSNKELEQFAYVVSHDLQEPLRMVANYTQLLGRRYGEKLEASAHEFMAFIVDGAARMKQLIEDLLAYSRVGTQAREFRPVKLEAVVERARFNLRAALEESGGELTHDPLPEVEGDESQLVQLFQNLAGNALKFRAEAPPRVHVSAVDMGEEFEIRVQDNGIGIEPEYFERIFMVFQRLHTRGEYAGTGIGLAICKKVVERHGGRIWVESAPGRGCCFKFTLRKPPVRTGQAPPA